MKRINLDNWKFTKKIPAAQRAASATIHLKYPGWKIVTKYRFSERKIFRNNYLRTNLKKLLDTNHIGSLELIGSKIHPRGVKVNASLDSLLKLSRLSFIDSINIERLQGAIKKPAKQTGKYFCIKMTVAIEVEGSGKNGQDCEDRYLLIKAMSRADAYKKAAREAKKYAEPYLNTDLRLVSWKTESYDDCFEPFIANVNDLNRPEGIEVFSKISSRRKSASRRQ